MKTFLLADAIDLTAPSEYLSETVDFSDDLVPFLPNYSVTAFSFASTAFEDAEVIVEGRNDTDVDVWTELFSITAAGPKFTDIVLPLQVRVRTVLDASSPTPDGAVSITLIGN